jgi:HSP20 family protein
MVGWRRLATTPEARSRTWRGGGRVMKAMLPPPGVTSLRKEMDRLFDRIWDGDEFTTMGEWNPLIDFRETKDTLIAKVEVPGIEPKDIQVTLENGVLTIKGEKRKDLEEKDEKFYRMERSYGSFARSIRLPIHVETQKVIATFKDGLLTVVMPKAPEAKGTTIPIQMK